MSLFDIKVLSENQYWLADSVQKNYFLYFEMQAQKVKVKEDRIPLNISLVVDRSGSMNGDKLAYVKKAINFVIDNLSSDDYLSIVQYDNEIDVVSASQKVKDKAGLHRKISQISARGTTNLSGGMLEGYDQVNSTKQEKFVNRTLLLSDGLANSGITDPQKLQLIVQKKFRELGIGLSTFGVGAQFNEVLMTNLAEYGGANYYFIDSPDQIPQIFAEELTGLLSVLSQSTKLTFKFPREYFKCEFVYGYPYDVESGEVKVNFNDVISEEKKAVLVKLQVLKPIDKEVKIGINLSYEDVVETMGKISTDFELLLKPTQNEALFKEGAEPAVIEQIVYFSANQWYEDAINRGDKRDFQGAKQLIAQAKEYIEAHFKSYPQTEELKKLYDLINQYDTKLDEMKSMSNHDYMMTQKMSRSMHYMAKRKK